MKPEQAVWCFPISLDLFPLYRSERAPIRGLASHGQLQSDLTDMPFFQGSICFWEIGDFAQYSIRRLEQNRSSASQNFIPDILV